MGLFDLFDFSWKKEFEELLSSNREAVNFYVKKKYKVYEDMRPDDKSLIKDYLQTYDSVFLPLTQYIDPIESLSKEAKKFLIQRKSEVIRLYKSFSKYSTPHKRVLSLYERFKKDNYFDKAFGDYLGENYDINNLSEEQILFILDNQLLPSLYAAEDRDRRNKRLKEQRDKLRERYIDREISSLLKRQKQLLPKEIQLPNKRSKLTAKLRSMIDQLAEAFSQNGIFQRVCSFHYADFETIESLADSQYIYILVHQEDFEKEKKFFEMAKEESIEEKAYKSYLNSKKLTDNHEGILYCLEHFEEIPLFVSASEQDAKFVQWISTQKVLNEKSRELAAHFLPKFRCRNLRMYIDYKGATGEQVRKVLPFNLYSMSDYTNEVPTPDDMRQSYAFVYYIKRNAQKALKSEIIQDTTTMVNIGFFVYNIMIQMAVGGVTVALGSSGKDTPKAYNNRHFFHLIKKLEQQGISCVNVNELTNENVKKNIVIVEMVSEVERLRRICRAISKRFPGSNLTYISFYNELTKNQLNAIKERK